MPDDPTDQPEKQPAGQPEKPEQPDRLQHQGGSQPQPAAGQPEKNPEQPGQKPSRHERRMQRLQERKAGREQEKKQQESGQKKKRLMNAAFLGVVVLVVLGLGYGAYSLLSTNGPDEFYGLKLPKVGDHWHASYSVTLCGETRPTFGEPPLGDQAHSIHSHDDNLIHLEIASPAFAGAAANLKAFFAVYGVTLTNSSISYPGERTYTDGDSCPNSTAPGRLQLKFNNRPHELAERYVPQDGDTISVVFG